MSLLVLICDLTLSRDWYIGASNFVLTKESEDRQVNGSRRYVATWLSTFPIQRLLEYSRLRMKAVIEFTIFD